MTHPTPIDPPAAAAISRPAPVDPERLRLQPWVDPLVERLGHDPRSIYVEQFWLGILGPSTVWLLRHAAHQLDRHPEGTTVCLTALATQLGIGHRGGRNSPMTRAVLRACRFGAARTAGRTVLEVRRRLAPLNRRQVEQLPTHLRSRHDEATRSVEGSADLKAQQGRARRLALGLIECGDRVDVVETQLGSWRFHPAVAAEAVNWAWQQRASTGSEDIGAA